MNGTVAIDGELRRVGMTGAPPHDARRVERPPAIVGSSHPNIGAPVFTDAPGEIDRVVVTDGQSQPDDCAAELVASNPLARR